MNKRSWKRAGAFVIIALIAVLTIAVGGAVAAPSYGPIVPEAATPTAQNQRQPVSNDVCLGCHNNPSLTKKLYDGTDLSLYVKPEDHANSVHGQAGLMCVQCHSNFDEKHTENPVQYPGFQANDRRDVTLKLYPLCQQCHADQYDKAIDSVHGRAMQNGNVNAAVCVDCHTAHTVRRLTDATTKQLLAGLAYLDPSDVRQVSQHSLHSIQRQRARRGPHSGKQLGCTDMHRLSRRS